MPKVTQLVKAEQSPLLRSLSQQRRQALGMASTQDVTPVTASLGWPQGGAVCPLTPWALRSPYGLEKALRSLREGSWWGGSGLSGRSRQ